MILRSPKEAILMQSPYLPIANKAIEQMKAMLLEFEMTPASRSRIDTSKLDGTGATTIEEYSIERALLLLAWWCAT